MSRFVEDKVLYRPSKAGLALGIAMTLAIATSALAEDMLRLAIGQRGLWNTCISEVGQRGGIFKRHGINLEILYTQGSGETQQAAIAGSVDIAVGVGTMGVLSAYSKGVTGLDLIILDAIEMKFINAASSQQQLADLIQIPPRK